MGGLLSRPLPSLPLDIWIHIFSYLPAKALCNISKVDHFCYRLANFDDFWKRLCEEKDLKKGNLSWKICFQEFYLQNHIKYSAASSREYDYLFKTIIGGDARTGKSCLQFGTSISSLSYRI
jgi:hypothetical protein